MATYNERIETLALLLADARRERNEAKTLLARAGTVLEEMQPASRDWQADRTTVLSAIAGLLAH
jgi:F0F1-type ATP synthase membrane subunit b/b'